MPVFVTGGTGFIGQHVVHMLLARGATVHLLCRRPPRSLTGHPPNLHLFCGDLMDRQAVCAAMQGCQTALHLAGCTRVWAKDPLIYHRTNVLGTGNVLAEARQLSLQKVVYTSSCAAVSVVGDGTADERSFREPERVSTPYARSKWLAEKVVWSALEQGVPITVVYPTRVYGPGRITDGNAATKAIDLYRRGKLPCILGDGAAMASWAYVADVARGCILALEKGHVGQRYILGGDNLSLNNVFALIDRLTETTHRQVHVPRRLALAVALFEECKANLLGLPPLITRGWVEALFQSRAYSSERAIQHLGYHITPLQAGLTTTIRWLDDHGKCSQTHDTIW